MIIVRDAEQGMVSGLGIILEVELSDLLMD